MRKLFYPATVLAFAIAMIVGARAADLKPVLKAPAVPFLASGVYMGMGSAAATDRSEISTPALGTTGTATTVGGAMEAIIGYHTGTAESFKDAELAIGYSNLGGVQTNIGGAGFADINSRLYARGTFKLGGTQTYANLLAALQNLGPNLGLNGVLTPPTVGPGALPYLALDVKASRLQSSLGGIDALGNALLIESTGWQVRPGIGMGVYQAIMSPTTGRPTGCMMDTSMHYYPAGKGISFGGDGVATLGREFEARLAMVC